MPFGFYKSMTLASAQAGSADSTNWPLCIGLNGVIQAADLDLRFTGSGGHVANVDGDDIRPYADAAHTTPLDYEKVYYDGSLGQLIMWVRVPTMSHSVDPVIYLFYGDASLNTDGSVRTTWNANYKGVYHFGDGTTLSVADSSQSNQTAVNSGATAVAGQFQGAAGFVGASTQYIYSGIVAASVAVAAGTIEWWQYNTNAFNSGLGDCPWGMSQAAALPSLSFLLFTDSNLYVGWITVAGGDQRVIITGSSAVWPQAVETHYTVTWNTAGNTIVYCNGSVIGSGAVTATEAPAFVGMDIGRFGSLSGGSYYSGRQSEWRFLATDVSPSWVTANVNSQKAGSTFITWGAETPVTAGSGFSLGFIMG